VAQDVLPMAGSKKKSVKRTGGEWKKFSPKEVGGLKG